MIKLLKLKTIAAAAGACAAMIAATPASAFVYGVSHLNIRNLTLTVSPTTTINDFSFDLTQSATLNGMSDFSTNSCGGTGSFGAGLATTCSGVSPVLDSRVVNAPGSAPFRAENVFTFNGPNAVNTLSNADSVIRTAQLVQGTSTSTEQIAESQLNINGNARANAEIQSNTSLTATFVGGGTLVLAFEADPDQLSQIGGAQTGSFLSQTNLNASFTLTNSQGGAINFRPNGDGTNSCTITGLGFAGVICTEDNDGADLNENTSASLNPGADDNSFEVGDVFAMFGITIMNLANDTYQIAFNTNTSTSIRNQVNAIPEPGTTGLIGVALAGLALTTRRKHKQS